MITLLSEKRALPVDTKISPPLIPCAFEKDVAEKVVTKLIMNNIYIFMRATFGKNLYMTLTCQVVAGQARVEKKTF